MPQLTWVTPAGTIGNLPIGLLESIELLAVDTTNNGATLTYTLISGALPPGMTLDSSTGIISGTPEYSTPSDNYFTTLSYNFIVRLSTSNNLTPVDRGFSLIITNKVNADFTWVTPGGSLGTVPNGEFYQLPLLVSETQANTAVTFSFISGELPPGMQVVETGYLQGVPTLTSAVKTGTSQDFRFTLRATNSYGHVRDQAFSLNVTNVFGPIIEPTSTQLGSFFDGSFYSQQLTVNEPSPNVSITWSNIGMLPPGVTLSSTGLLSGYILPAVVETSYGPAGYDAGTGINSIPANSLVANVVYQIQSVGSTNFKTVGARDNTVGTVFVANSAGTGTGIASIYNVIVQAPYLVVGQTYQIQSLGTTDFTQFGAGTNTIGTIFTATASGSSSAGTGTVSQYVSGNNLTVQQEYDVGPYDFSQVSQTKSYNFTIRAFDGVNYDLQPYVLNVISRSDYTADSTQFFADNTGLYVDATNTYTPVLLNTVTTLPAGRGGSYYAFKFNGLDFQGDTVTYSLSNTVGTFDAYVATVDGGFDYNGAGPDSTPESEGNPGLPRYGVGFDSYDNSATSRTNLPGLVLDAQSGWIYGLLTPQSSSYVNYKFGIIVSKTRNGVTYSSNPIYFNLPVLGDVNNTINWITPSNLGNINNGSISEIVLEASSIEGKPLVYNLVDAAGVPIRLPQGLELITTQQNNKYLGLLSGRVSFQAFSVDDYNTTFDKNSMTVDRVYNFTVEVATADATYGSNGTLLTPPSSSAVREFTLTLNVVDIEPYNNLYLKALPAWDQRQIFNNVISNTEIFVPELIYRPNDPWFGVAKDIEMLFLPGLQPDDLNTYANAIVHNHYTKTYTFGDISTAVVLDSNYNVKYEVVYINVIDPGETTTGAGPALKNDLTNVIANPYIDSNGNDYKIVYPNSSANMVERLAGGVGYYDQSSLPNWMTSNQPDPSNNLFVTPLGFTKAVVLAYTIPGASKLIAYRLRNSGINFNRIDFTADRYIVDDFYTSNFNVTTKQFDLGKQTTFDVLPNLNVGSIVATVNYAVNIPFNQINGRTISYINNNGGIDGVTNFQDGDTLIFAQQENFLNAGMYVGWIDYTDSYIGDNNTTTAIEGYDSEGYDNYYVIPGYSESSQAGLFYTGDGVTDTFNITSNSKNIQVYVNGAMQPSTAYSIGTNSIRFVSAPPAPGAIINAKNIIVYYNGTSIQDQFAGNAVQNTFTLSRASSNTSITVVVNGQVLLNNQYSVSGTNLVFNAAPSFPPLPPNIEIRTSVNERGGIWQVKIVDNFVNLLPIQEILPGQRLRVSNGNTYSGSIVYYNQILNVGQTVPYYSVYKLQSNAVTTKTTFNGDTTKFFSFKDQYYTPGQQGQYLKFPQYGVFT